MKVLALFALVCASFSALACPDFEGNYECIKNNRTTSQKTVENFPGGIRVTDFNSSIEYPTDGSIMTLPDHDSMKDAKYTGRCDGKKIIIDFTATIMDTGTEIARQKSSTTFEKKDGKLVITRKTKMKNIPMPTVKEVCTLI